MWASALLLYGISPLSNALSNRREASCIIILTGGATVLPSEASVAVLPVSSGVNVWYSFLYGGWSGNAWTFGRAAHSSMRRSASDSKTIVGAVVEHCPLMRSSAVLTSARMSVRSAAAFEMSLMKINTSITGGCVAYLLLALSGLLRHDLKKTVFDGAGHGAGGDVLAVNLHHVTRIKN